MYLILFDVDGTIVDSQNIIFEGFSRTFAALGRPAPRREDVLQIIGRSLPEATATLLGLEESNPLVTEAVVGYKTAFQDLRRIAASYEALYPQARETIDALRARPDVILGIATGKSKRGVRAIIDAHGFEGIFATIQTADDHPSKPHPSMIVTAMAETGITPERTLMIGDSSYDMLMARSAGVTALGVSWGYQAVDQLTSAGAHEIVTEYPAVEPAIARLLNW
jgi:phosphoglycolate phosphatase